MSRFRIIPFYLLIDWGEGVPARAMKRVTIIYEIYDAKLTYTFLSNIHFYFFTYFDEKVSLLTSRKMCHTAVLNFFTFPNEFEESSHEVAVILPLSTALTYTTGNPCSSAD